VRPFAAAAAFAAFAVAALAVLPGIVLLVIFIAGPAVTGLLFSREKTRFTSASLGATTGSALASATWILTHPEDGVSYWAVMAGALVSMVIMVVLGAGVSALVAGRLTEEPLAEA
jgi:ABC-type sugar transport system permease subunit